MKHDYTYEEAVRAGQDALEALIASAYTHGKRCHSRARSPASEALRPLHAIQYPHMLAALARGWERASRERMARRGSGAEERRPDDQFCQP